MDLRLPKGVVEVVLLRQDDHGRHTTRTVYRRHRRRKRGTQPLDELGRVVRKVVAGQKAAAEKYLDRHDASNRDKADGWVQELSYNVYRATGRGLRKVRRALGLPSIVVDD
jgi:hypothetical protein